MARGCNGLVEILSNGCQAKHNITHMERGEERGIRTLRSFRFVFSKAKIIREKSGWDGSETSFVPRDGIHSSAANSSITHQPVNMYGSNLKGALHKGDTVLFLPVTARFTYG